MDASRDDQELARLRADFPGWRFILSDRHRWWALCGPLPAGRMNEVDVIDADTLRVALAEQVGNRRTR